MCIWKRTSGRSNIIFRTHPFVQVFREVLQTCSIVIPEFLDQLGEVSEKNPPLENVSNLDGSTMKFSVPEVLYTFVPPLHMRYVQWMLLSNLDEGAISENSTVNFVSNSQIRSTQPVCITNVRYHYPIYTKVIHKCEASVVVNVCRYS